jgi:hypothetical protein
MADTFLSNTSGRLSITLRSMEVGSDLLVVITGGKAHIGATAVGITCGGLASASVITVPAHREDRVVKSAAEKLAKALDRSVVVVAGIHYDAITKDEIDESLRLCDELVNALAVELCRKE